MDSQWTNNGLTMDSKWIRNGLTKDPHRTHNGLTMCSQWTHNGLTMDSHCTHNGLTTDSQRTHTGLTPKIIETAMVLLGCPRKWCHYNGFRRLSATQVACTYRFYKSCPRTTLYIKVKLTCFVDNPPGTILTARRRSNNNPSQPL
jgi:hypothetical protein